MAERSLTEPEAWRAIAENIDAEGIEYGLCWEVWGLDISFEMNRAMRCRIDAHLALYNNNNARDNDEDPSFFEQPGVGENRLLLALFFALEAEDEGAA